MKKLIVLGILILMASLTSFKINSPLEFVQAFPDAEAHFYVDVAGRVPPYATVKPNGIGEIISCPINVALALEKTLPSIKGKAYITQGDKKAFNKIMKLLNMTVLKTEKIEESVNIYGFVQGEGRCVFMDGKKVNVEVSFSGDKIIVGYPVILGSY